MDMGQGLQPVGGATPQEWRHQEVAAQLQERADAKVEVRRERLTVSGTTFDCMVVTSGAHVAWVPATGDVPTFPGIVKATSEGKVTLELVVVEQP